MALVQETALAARPARRAGISNPEITALMTAIVLLGGVLGLVLMRTGGAFTYSLDDPYIHLALAEQVRGGHYGINAGEFTSPASSILWPLLLVPTAGTALHPWMPLILNVGFGLATAWLLGRFAAGLPLPADLPRTGLQRAVIAAALVVVANVVGLAFTGLEHNLQVLIACAVGVALIRHAEGVALPGWAIAAAAIGPAVRYELFALTAAVAVVLLLARDWRRLAALSAGALVIPVGFSLFLLANGNMALPNSVMTKLTTTMPAAVEQTWLDMLAPEYFVPRLGLAAMSAFLGFAAWRSGGRERAVLAGFAVIGPLHIVCGQFGWFFRYEVYALVTLGLATLAVLARIKPALTVVLALVLAQPYLGAVLRTPAGAQNVHLQQQQMHRFVSEHYRAPFAVNDLGWVSMERTPGMYVLDLWGLASNEAVRQKVKSAAWLDAITREKGAGLAMIYTRWFPETPQSWTRVADLVMDAPLVTVADRRVTFFATGVGDAGTIRSQLEAFAGTLPRGARLVLHRWGKERVLRRRPPNGDRGAEPRRAG